MNNIVMYMKSGYGEILNFHGGLYLKRSGFYMTVTRGLEGVVATSSSISSIINDTLTYVGYNIDDLTENASFEEVIYLLWHRKLPTKAQLNELKQQLSSSAGLPKGVLDQFKTYPIDQVHPMAALRTAVSQLGLYDPEADTMSLRQIIEKRFAYKQNFRRLLLHLHEFVKG